MSSEVSTGVQMSAALGRFHEVSNGRLEIMCLTYDLDGAVDAGQVGLARYTATSLLDAAVACWLRERGVAVPTFAHVPARARVALSILEAVNPDLAGRVSAAYRGVAPPTADAVRAHCDDVLGLVGELLGYGVGGLRSAVCGWVESARETRRICEQLGVPVKEFYWTPPDAETWYSDVLRFAPDAPAPAS
jgi:hypothetical protein